MNEKPDIGMNKEESRPKTSLMNLKDLNSEEMDLNMKMVADLKDAGNLSRRRYQSLMELGDLQHARSFTASKPML